MFKMVIGFAFGLMVAAAAKCIPFASGGIRFSETPFISTCTLEGGMPGLLAPD